MEIQVMKPPSVEGYHFTGFTGDVIGPPNCDVTDRYVTQTHKIIPHTTLEPEVYLKVFVY